VTNLQRKALRDLWHLRGQAAAIALVIAGGIANLVMAQSCYQSLEETRARFYRDYAFADAWAGAKRVPEAVAARLAGVDGVQRVETRLLAPANLSLPDFDEPIKAQIMSLPEEREPELNRMYLRAGRALAPYARSEVLISEAFAEAHKLGPGSRLRATIYGRSEWFHVVGIAISPEFVYQIQPGAAFPDFKRFGIVWMNRKALEAALDMDGAFNNVALRLMPGANEPEVLARVDALLARYGGIGAYGREDQLSNKFLSEELRQLRTMALLFPTVFLSVAAFLLNVVLTRLVGTQRDQIAILKAFGYDNAAIGRHYAFLVALIGLLGTAIGLAGGVVLGGLLSRVYQEFYRFPFLDFRLSASVVLTGVAVSMAAALLGTAQAVLRAARLPPAEAMRPPAPESYRRTVIERIGLGRFLSQPTRMIARHIERRPVKALLSIIGLALACAIMMIGRFQKNSIDYMVDVQYRLGQRNDVSVDFTEATGRRAAFELASLPGVHLVEPYRSASVRLRHENRSYRTGLQGLLPDGELKRPVDTGLQRVALPAEGLLMTDYLAQILDVHTGDTIQVEQLDGRQVRTSARIAGLVKEYIGVQAYMSLDAMNRLLQDGDVVSGAYLAVDADRQTELYRRLEQRPRVAGIGVRRLTIRNFYDTMAESLLVFTFISMLLGAVINFGVVYNSARIALSERGRELASLRVLGFSRGEVAYILLGELGFLVLVSLPLGFAAGYVLCVLMATGLQSDLFRVPVHITSETYAFAAITVAVSTVLSALIVRLRIQRLDLVEVLKTRE
jgi:putative ABC transport system permease protein